METTSWNDIEKEIFSPKEIEDSKRRIAKIGLGTPLYRCDSFKNKECKKTSCYEHNGGSCYSTLDVSYALLDQYGRPILSDEYINLLISGMYKQQKLDREDIDVSSNEEE